MAESVLPVQEAARMYPMPLSSFYRLLRLRADFPQRRLGRAVAIPEAEYRKWLERNRPREQR
jgi:predicted DNA-binding transcriptional regulator AlpA